MTKKTISVSIDSEIVRQVEKLHRFRALREKSLTKSDVYAELLKMALKQKEADLEDLEKEMKSEAISQTIKATKETLKGFGFSLRGKELEEAIRKSLQESDSR